MNSSPTAHYFILFAISNCQGGCSGVKAWAVTPHLYVWVYVAWGGSYSGRLHSSGHRWSSSGLSGNCHRPDPLVEVYANNNNTCIWNWANWIHSKSAALTHSLPPLSPWLCWIFCASFWAAYSDSSECPFHPSFLMSDNLHLFGSAVRGRKDSK